MPLFLESTLRKSSLLLNHIVTLVIVCFVIYALVMSKQNFVEFSQHAQVIKVSNGDYLQVRWFVTQAKVCNGVVEPYVIGLSNDTLSTPLMKQPIFPYPVGRDSNIVNHKLHERKKLVTGSINPDNTENTDGISFDRYYSLNGVHLRPGEYVLYVDLSSYCYGFGLLRSQQAVSIPFSVSVDRSN